MRDDDPRLQAKRHDDVVRGAEPIRRQSHWRMSLSASASRVAEISAAARPRISWRRETPPRHGQLRHPQRTTRASLAQKASTLHLPLRSNQFELAEFGRALV